MFRRSIVPKIRLLSRGFSTEVTKKDKPNQTSLILTGGFFLTSSYFLYKNLTNKIDIETLSIKELKEKDDFEKITILDGKTAIIQKTKEKYYRVNILNGDYFEKHIKTEAPIYFEQSTNFMSYLGPMISLGILGTVLFMMSRNANGLKGMLT